MDRDKIYLDKLIEAHKRIKESLWTEEEKAQDTKDKYLISEHFTKSMKSQS